MWKINCKFFSENLKNYLTYESYCGIVITVRTTPTQLNNMEEDFMMTFEAIRAMTTADIKKRMRDLTVLLESPIDPEPWHEYYTEYDRYSAVLDERYREENQSAFDAFYAEHIEGKSWEEIDPEAWDFYSDWHKDMYGFRPRHI